MARAFRRNGAYNDPAIAAAAQNLAGLFAPPTGADAYAWAKARAEQAEAGRMAEFYQYATDPTFNKDVFDRRAVALGRGSINNGYYGTDLAAATARRGQDVTAQTSILNNTADNARALQIGQMGDLTQRYGIDIGASTARRGQDLVNSANRYGTDIGAETARRGQDMASFSSRYGTDVGAQTAIRGQDITAETSRLNNTADNANRVTLKRMEPLTLGAGQTAFLPPEEAAARGLPGTLAGLYSASPGETLFAPGGQTLQGAEVPLSMTQWEARQAQRLQAGGQLGDQALVDKIVGERAPVQALGPNGAPTYMSPGAAVRTGATPYNPASAAAAPKLGLARLPDGSTVPARYDPTTQRWVQAQTGQPLPDNAVPSNLPTPTGSFGDATPAPTTANRTTANVMSADDTITLGMLDDYEKLILNNPGVTGMVGYLRGAAQDAGQSVADFARSFGDKPGVREGADAFRKELSAFAPELFDPSLPKAEFLRGAIAYRLAKTENPGAEVSRHAYDRAYGRIGGGVLANQASTLAQIGSLRDLVRQRMQGTQVLNNPGAARTDPSFQQPSPSAATPQGPMVIPTANGNVTIRRKDGP